MDIDLFKKIIDEIASKVYAVRLSLRGEATLHKQFVECVKYAKCKGINEVSTLTHGGNLHGKFMEEVIHAGIDWITISVDGVRDEYDRIRKPLKFEDTIDRLEKIKEFKRVHNLSKPVIKIQGIWPAIRPNPTEYYETFEPLSDLVAFNPLIDYLRKDSEIVYEDDFSCSQLYQRLVIGSDGRVMMCSNDEDGEHIIGDAYTESVHEIWHGKKLNEVRELHNTSNGFKQLDVCKQCYYPRKTIADEIAKCGNREILIENYIHRSQQVGN
jgi:radical SAM protein with 4Fe4S-binding SPASM domain